MAEKDQKGDQVAASIFAWKILPADKHVMTLPSDVFMQEPLSPSRVWFLQSLVCVFTRDRLWVYECSFNIVGFSLC